MLLRSAVLALLLGVTALPRIPKGAPGPAKGVFLVAREEIEGGPFWHSVVLIVSHGTEGTLGVIVNRATDTTLKDVLPDLEREESSPHPIHFGGPVTLDGLVFLFRADAPPEGATPVLGDVYFEGRLETLERLLAEKSAVKLFLGHAGWSPGQLQSELVRGSWDLVEADTFTLFGKDPATLWPELSGRSRTLAKVSGFLTSAHSALSH